DDFVIAPRNLRAQRRPGVDFAPFAVNLAQLFDADLVQRIILMDINGERVVADHEFLWLVPVFGLGFLHFVRFELATAVGDVAGPVNEGGDAHARAAAGDFDGDVRIDLGICFRPGLGQIHHRVRADVLNLFLVRGQTGLCQTNAQGQQCAGSYTGFNG